MQEAAAAMIRITDSRDMSEGSSVTESAGNALKRLGHLRKSAMETAKIIPVQFNPTTLEFANTGVGMKEEVHTISSVLQDADRDKQQGKGKREKNAYTVSMKLIFDRSDNLLPGVQTEVETFLSLLKNPYLNNISFYWGTLFFSGILESVDAEYIMFDCFGRPVRANVKLKLKVTENEGLH